MKTFAPLILATGLISLAAAQVYPEVDPEDIDPSTRFQWCVQQKGSCTGLCQDQTKGGTEVNECNDEDLSFSCICEDGTSPNATEYSLAIPFNKCQQSKQLCVNNCNGDHSCADKCFTGKSCGASDPTRVNITTTTTSAGSSATASGTRTGSAGGAGATDDSDPFNGGKNMGARLASFGSAYGIGVMVIGIAAGFIGIL